MFFALSLSLEATDNSIGSDGTWTTGGSWSLGHFPDGSESANILVDVTVDGGTTLSANNYTGNLILNRGAYLNLNSNSERLEDHLPSDPSSNIFMYEGSKIYMIDQNIFDIYNPIELYGAVTIQQHYNSDKKTYYGHISGNGSIYFDMNAWGNTEESYLSPTTPNTYTGGTTIFNRKNEFHITSNGALGTGDVKIGGDSTPGSVKFTGTTDVIDDGAELWMNEYGILNLGGGTETVRILLFDGVVQNPTGYPETWGTSSSGANQTNDSYFTGTGILTVTGNADATAPWPNPMTFASVPSGNSDTSIQMTATTATDLSAVEYFFENIDNLDNSGWQSELYWCDEGLTPSTNYNFHVKARNAQGVETAWSDRYTSTPSIYNTLITDGASWNTAGAWSLGHVPTGGETVVISNGNSVTSNTTPSSSYTGSLVIEAGGSLLLTSNTADFEDYVPSGTAGAIRLNEGATIQMYQLGDTNSTSTHNIELYGDATFKNTNYNTELYLNGIISGSGAFKGIIDASYQTKSLHFAGSVPNTYTGGTNISSESIGGNEDEFYVDSDGCLGTGNVIINDGVRLEFGGTTTDVIDDTADLYLNDAFFVDLNANSEIVNRLYIDGVLQSAGTYGSSDSSAKNVDNVYFGETGMILVTYNAPTTPDNYIGRDVEWNSPTAWAKLHIPTGTESANILADTTVTGSTLMSGKDFSGNLTLNIGATLDLNNSAYHLEDYFPSESTSTVFLHEGSRIYIVGQSAFDIDHPIVLKGATEIDVRYNAYEKHFKGLISGPGGFHFKVSPHSNADSRAVFMDPASPNTYVGGTKVTVGDAARSLRAAADGAFGTGDLIVAGGIVDFSGATTDVIANGAELWLNTDGKIDLNANNETVRLLLFNSVIQNPSGYPDTWGSTSSGANNQNDTYFSGTGVLTVTGNADVTAPWPNPMTFSIAPAGNSLTSVGMTATTATDISAVEYFFENIDNSDNSGWQSGTYWCDEGLTPDTAYRFHVKARNAQGIETAWSDLYSSTGAIYNYLITDGASWNTSSAWSQGHVPTGSETVVVTAGNTVTSNTTPLDSYTGDLILEAGGTLSLTAAASDIEDYVPSGTTGGIYFYEGGTIQMYDLGDNSSTLTHNIFLNGAGTFKNTHYNTSLYLTGVISGSGSFKAVVDASFSNPSLHLAGSVFNTYTGGSNISSESLGGNDDEFYVDVDGCLGTGDVIVNDGVYVDFGGATTDVIDDAADLYLFDTAEIDLNANNETIHHLYIDGALQVSGTYGSTASSAENQNDTYFYGTGVLTVLGPVPGTVIRVE